MISRKTPNFLLKPLLKFLLLVYLFISKLFHVDFEPKDKIDDSYTKFNSFNDPLPDIELNNPDHQEILADARENGEPIKPVNRRKPLTVDVDGCSKCGAPKEYLYSFGHDPDGYQKFQCKVCDHQWAPEKPEQRPKTHPTYRCPFYGYALSKEKERKNFTKYKCRNDDCSKWENEHKRYRYRAYDFDADDLEVSRPDKEPVNLDHSQYGNFIISKAMDFFIGLGLSLRQTSRALKLAFNVSPSAQTIQNWTVSLAYRLGPKIKELDLPLSGIVAVDETYIKVKGSWHYLFTAIDGKNGCIIAQHLSRHRDAKGAITILKRIIEQYQDQDFVLVSDMAPIYSAAIHAAKIFFGNNIEHKQVKGLFTDDENSDELYRPYKNIIERFFGTYKAHYNRHKSFSSLDGAIAHATLYQLYFNYLKPHSTFDDKPPLVVENSRGQPIESWAQLIKWINKSDK
ncbi:MAG TPA: DDE-type integrase/transposase/recombinase [Clostridia bacterium]|nr:DDE-type integrase/transposase/recombinase [Clostridia bacterium]